MRVRLAILADEGVKGVLMEKERKIRAHWRFLLSTILILKKMASWKYFI
jgi:hypothetical protein